MHFTVGDKNNHAHRYQESNAATTSRNKQYVSTQKIVQNKVPLSLNFDEKHESRHLSFTPRTSIKVYNYTTEYGKTDLRANTPGTMSTEAKDGQW